MPENVREVAPTTFFAVPRIWEKFYSGIAIAHEGGDPARQHWAYRRAIGDRLSHGRAPSSTGAAAAAVAEARQRASPTGSCSTTSSAQIGLHRCRFAVTGAAPIAPDLIRWYLALGIDMREVYGQTENCGVATVMPATASSSARSAQPRPGPRSMISPEGEILLKGDPRLHGLPQPAGEDGRDADATAGCTPATSASSTTRAISSITDRMKDIIITAGGKNITPSEIENQLKFSPYISDAVVIGDKRPYLTCLIMIDHENVEKFAQDHDVPFTNYATLCRARGGPGPDLARDRGGQRELRAGRDHQEVPPDRAAAHRRGRGADADHEAQAQLREQEYAAEIEAMYRERAVA